MPAGLFGTIQRSNGQLNGTEIGAASTAILSYKMGTEAFPPWKLTAKLKNKKRPSRVTEHPLQARTSPLPAKQTGSFDSHRGSVMTPGSTPVRRSGLVVFPGFRGHVCAASTDWRVASARCSGQIGPC